MQCEYKRALIKDLPSTAPRNPSAQGYAQQQQQYPQHGYANAASPMLSPPVGFAQQQVRGPSPGYIQHHAQPGLGAPASPVMMHQQPQQGPHMPGQQQAYSHQGQGLPVPQSQSMNARQPSFNNGVTPGTNGLEQHMAQLNVGGPSTPGAGGAFVSVL